MFQPPQPSATPWPAARPGSPHSEYGDPARVDLGWAEASSNEWCSEQTRGKDSQKSSKTLPLLFFVCLFTVVQNKKSWLYVSFISGILISLYTYIQLDIDIPPHGFVLVFQVLWNLKLQGVYLKFFCLRSESLPNSSTFLRSKKIHTNPHFTQIILVITTNMITERS